MVFKRIRKGIKKVAKRGLGAAVGVARGVATGQSLRQSIHNQVVKEVGSITGQGAYSYRRRAPAQRRTIRGRGDYELAGAPGSLMNPRTAFEPRMKNEAGSVEISRSEYLGDLYSSASGTPATSFQLQNYFVNPGLDISVGGASAWLAPIGASFQQYRYKQLVFEFRSTSGSSVASANTTLGTVIMACAYDSSRPNFTNKQQMMDAQFAVSAAPDKSIMFPVECKSQLEAYKLWDIRTGALLSGQSQNTYDFVNFQIATQGMQSNSINLGELWVHYTVCLEKTNIGAANTLIKTANYRWTGAANSNVSNGFPLGTGGLGNTLTPNPGSSLALTFDYTGGAQRVILPFQVDSGNYIFIITWGANVAAAWSEPALTLTNAVIDACIFSPVSAFPQTGFISNNQILTPLTIQYEQVILFTVTGPNCSVNLGAGFNNTTGGITDVCVLVQEMNTNASTAGT